MHHRLRFVAFLAGFVSLAFEITFARMLAPSFGTSLFVWTNVIGVILVGMSAGAFLGGRLADRRPDMRLLGWIIAGTGVYLLLLPTVAAPFLRVASAALTDRATSIFLASLAATLVLAIVPALTLGMVTPFVLRLRASSLETIGSDAGGLSALATLGSIIGTFVPTLLTIPTMGVRATIFLLAAFLLVGAMPLFGRRAAVLLVLPLLAWPLPFRSGATPETIAMADSPYQFVAVDRSPGGVLTMRMNEGQAIHSILIPGQLRTTTIYDAFTLLPAMRRGEFDTMANVGLAGGTIAHLFQQLFPQVRVTGIELDPAVIALGRKYFTLNEPNLTVMNQDGRIALAAREDRYDAIVVDAYRQPYIPFHLATREFFALCRSRLTEGGIFAMNVATTGREDAVLTSILNTVAGEYAETWVYQVPDAANFLVVASDDPGIMDRLRTGTVPEEVRDLQTLVAGRSERVTFDPANTVLTDDRAPVEIYTEWMLFNEAT